MSENEINEILHILGNPVSPEKFQESLNTFCPNDRTISEGMLKTVQFISYFNKYLKDSEFKTQIYKIIESTYEICEKVDDLPDLLLKTSALNFIDIYINFSDISANIKESMLNVLGGSFGELLPGPQILNLCLMVEPVFKNESYLNNKNKIEEVE
ncbi:MAG: hypothetical protein GY870_07945, partial [archaeon]|nr:hypothetical protein [archaeon]